MLRLALLCASSFGLCLALLAAVLRLWEANLRIPLQYLGDAIVFLVKAKGIADGEWIYSNSRLGAPFTADFRDFPVYTTFDSVLMWLGSFVGREPGFLVNGLWIFGICVTAAIATYCLRRFDVAPAAAVVIGAVYALQPYIFYRGISHLNMLYYVVPLVATAAIELATGRIRSVRTIPAYAWAGFALCGFMYTYTAFFSCFVIACAGLLAYVARREWRAVGAAAVLFAVGVAATVVDLSPSLLHWARNGRIQGMNYKTPAEADVYGLKVRVLLTPAPDHAFPLFRLVERQLGEAFAPFDNENGSTRLGTVGAIGFVALAVASLAAMMGRSVRPEMRVCAGLLWLTVLVASIGGFGGVFNTFITADIRCYNRIFPFVAFYCLLPVAFFLTRAAGWWRLRGYPVALFAALLVGGSVAAAYDQSVPRGYLPHGVRAAGFLEDQAFVRRVEAVLPGGSSVFQLPHIGYPFEHLPGKYYNYDRGRPYVHSEKYRWSFGGINGSLPDEWGLATAGLGAPEMLHRLHHAGFAGLWVDVGAYPADQSPEAALTGLLGDPLKSAEGRFLFYDLRQYGEGVAAQEGAGAELAAHPVQAYFERGFFTEEAIGAGRWRWAKSRARVALVNPLPVARTVRVAFGLDTRAAGTQRLRIGSDGAVDDVEWSGRREYVRSVALPAGGVGSIDLECDCGRFDTPERRGISFGVVDLRVEE